MISRRPQSKRLGGQAEYFWSQACPATNHHLAHPLDIIRKAPDKQNPVGKTGNSCAQPGFEWQVESKLFRKGGGAARPNRPKRTKNAKTAESLESMPQRTRRIDQRPFDP